MSDGLVLASIAACGACVVALARRSLAVGIGSMVVAAVSHAAVLERAAIVKVGELGTLYVEDVAFVAVFVAAIIRIGTLGWWRRRVEGLRHLDRVALWVVLVLLALSFVRGIANYGAANASYEGRQFFYYAATVVYGVSFAGTPGAIALRDLRIGLSIGTAAILGIYVTRLLEVVTGHPGAWIEKVAGGPFRAVSAAEAMFLAEGALVVVSGHIWKSVPRRRWDVLLGVAALTAIVLLQHRTVWFVVIVWALALALSRGAGKMAIAVVMVGLAVSIVATRTEPREARLLESLASSLSEPTSERSTFRWRVEGWRVITGALMAGDAVDIAVGAPIGSGYGRVVWGRSADVQPHNFYVQMLARSGVLGAALWLFVLVRAMRRWRSAYPRPALMSLLVMGSAVFYAAYGSLYLDGAFLGLSLVCEEGASQAQE